MSRLGVSGRELNLRAEHQTISFLTGYRNVHLVKVQSAKTLTVMEPVETFTAS